MTKRKQTSLSKVKKVKKVKIKVEVTHDENTNCDLFDDIDTSFADGDKSFDFDTLSTETIDGYTTGMLNAKINQMDETILFQRKQLLERQNKINELQQKLEILNEKLNQEQESNRTSLCSLCYEYRSQSMDF